MMKYDEYKKYNTVTEWWEKVGRGKFPIQFPAAISKLQREKSLTFQESFEFLVDKKAVIFIDDKK